MIRTAQLYRNQPLVCNAVMDDGQCGQKAIHAVSFADIAVCLCQEHHHIFLAGELEMIAAYDISELDSLKAILTSAKTGE